MSELITIARPYARSAFEIAEAQQTIEAWSDVLKTLAEVVVKAELRQMLLDPSISKAQLAQAIVAAFGHGLAPEHANFIRLLVQSRRLELAEAICKLFEDYRTAAQNSIRIEVTSAYPLDDEQQRRLRQMLENKTRKTVKIDNRVDAALLGGAVVRFDDQVIDGSVQSRLNKLSAELMH